MDSNTELITAIAHQVSAYLKQAIQQREVAGEPVTLATLETELRECLRQTGAQALSEFLSTALGTPEATVPCACGERLHYQRRRRAVVLSVFGRVDYTRAYYAGCPCGHGKAPLDEHYGIEPGQVSAGLAKLLSLAGVELPFEHSARWLKAFLLFDVSENTVRQETQQMGQLQMEREADLAQQSQDEAYLQTRLRETRQVPQRLYGLIDAGKVRIEPRDSAEKAEKPGTAEAWRDMKLGCWCEAEAVPPAQRSVRQRGKYDREQAVYRAKNIRYYCDITDAATFGELLWARGVEAQADLAHELVFVCDGATWMQPGFGNWSNAIIQTLCRLWIGIMPPTALSAWPKSPVPWTKPARLGGKRSPKPCGRGESAKSSRRAQPSNAVKKPKTPPPTSQIMKPGCSMPVSAPPVTCLAAARSRVVANKSFRNDSSVPARNGLWPGRCKRPKPVPLGSVGSGTPYVRAERPSP